MFARPMLAALAAGALLLAAPAGARAEGSAAEAAQRDEAPIRVAIHVDESDPARINMALNNAANLRRHYAEEGREVEIEIVAYGPGLHMLRKDTSPVAERIAAMSMEFENLTFSACGNTMRGMSKREGKPVELLPEARVTPSGVVRLVELQRAGWAYVRP
ncbi:DsrE family protein [Oceanicella actignis]|uniref:Uncharacterized protein n=1 Tax=Oceanicella actignis TaxID=1189325 RepID=A0A1M7TZD6_9RHOB|nr:DsrE family protein [Oceanicella actignis]TYO85066.1 hypothetical protein LY05_02780 [Oceanicella actignis]SET83100.1 hypothetical protein SAMN04488119_1118 [Oceanicella actignis]SHN76079.1 hypothetical protein SAMN05216200_1127 [Oceanicella actignis]